MNRMNVCPYLYVRRDGGKYETGHVRLKCSDQMGIKAPMVMAQPRDAQEQILQTVI